MCSIYRASQGALKVQNSPANAGDVRDTDSIPRLGRSPGGEHGNLLQYSCLDNPMDRGTLMTTIHGVAKSQMILSMHALINYHQVGRFLSCSSLRKGRAGQYTLEQIMNIILEQTWEEMRKVMGIKIKGGKFFGSCLWEWKVKHISL